MYGTRCRSGGHDPGRVLVDLAVAIADGAETITDLRVSSNLRPGSAAAQR
jgi:hypothetical protein